MTDAPKRDGRRWILPVAVVLAASGAGALFFVPRSGPVPTLPAGPAPRALLADDFSAESLDASRWVSTAEGDFREKSVDVKEGRLKLRCGTIGTDDKTVKYLGVRSREAVRLEKETRISAKLDWNSQANGCYLSSALVLSPHSSDTNPLAAEDWLKIEYVGVPPGRNGRLVVAQRVKGRLFIPFTEGWPQVRREGRPIGVQKVEVVLRSASFEVWENGQKMFESKDKLPFESAHLYLQMSSHSNYPSRELYWDDIRVNSAE